MVQMNSTPQGNVKQLKKIMTKHEEIGLKSKSRTKTELYCKPQIPAITDHRQYAQRTPSTKAISTVPASGLAVTGASPELKALRSDNNPSSYLNLHEL